jgi:hypothetical protein
MHIRVWWEGQNERDRQEDIDEHGSVILKWILQFDFEVVWTVLIWLKLGTTGGLLRTQ